MTEIKEISSLSEIPPEGAYVLVMGGISTHDTLHQRGATFVINDGFLNPNRHVDRAVALKKAREFAEDRGLGVIYVLA